LPRLRKLKSPHRESVHKQIWSVLTFLELIEEARVIIDEVKEIHSRTASPMKNYISDKKTPKRGK